MAGMGHGEQTGNYCTGERMLHQCLDQRPDCVEARMLLIENVMAQGRSVYCWSPSADTSDFRYHTTVLQL